LLIWAIRKMLEARKNKLYEKCNEIVISRSNMSSDQSTMESIVSAQQGLYTVHEMMQIANISMLKIWSIIISKADKVHFLLTFFFSPLVKLQFMVVFGYYIHNLVPFSACKFSDGGNGWDGNLIGSDSIQILPDGYDCPKLHYDIRKAL